MGENRRPPRGPAPLPGEADGPLSRVVGLLAGVLVVVCLTLVAVVTNPALLGSATVPTASPGATAPVTPTGDTTEVTVTATGMAFSPSRIDVPAGEVLRITLVNDDTQSHDLVFANGAALPSIAPGARETVDVGVVTGNLQGWCSLPGHRQMGMVLDVVASGGAAAVPAGPGPVDAAVPTAAELKAEAAGTDPYPAELPALEDSRVHEVTLTVTEHEQRLSADVSRQVWTYDGTTPGPVLHGRVGDTFRVTLVNRGTMGHSIDFHAGALSPDGPMRTIAPGESLEYTFTATMAGIWMYHCSTVPMSEHIATGMFGAVVIEPDDLAPVDRSYVLIQSELYLGSNGDAADATKVSAATADLMAFNGRPFQYDAHPLVARAGERVRVWVLDAGPNRSWAFHVVGAQFDTVWTEGAYVIRGGDSPGSVAGAAGAQVLPLLAAQGGFVEFVPPEAGHYAIVNHEMNLAEKGAHGTLAVTGAT